ncbi:hypothetical protein LM602_09015 [Candidatus Acetothermia bacterium]|nr:hypothetical protein [Candidatus Acetothermia bacterium]MCI2435912.1 hypothetical protein [Candidatus Acetothermia bacterium]
MSKVSVSANDDDVLRIFSDFPTCYRWGPFYSRSRVRPLIFEIGPILSEPKHAAVVACFIAAQQQSHEFDLVIAPESSGIILGTLVSQVIGSPFVFVRKRKDYKTNTVIEGSYQRSARALLVDDIICTGKEAVRVLDVLPSDIRVIAASFVCRIVPPEPSPLLSQIPTYKWLVDVSTLTVYLMDQKAISEEIGQLFLDSLLFRDFRESAELLDKFRAIEKKYSLKRGDALVKAASS